MSLALAERDTATSSHIDGYGLAAQTFRNAVADLGIDRTTSRGFSSAASRIARGWASPWAQPTLDDDPARSLPHVGNGDHRGIHSDRSRHVKYAAPNAKSAVRDRSIVAAALSEARR